MIKSGKTSWCKDCIKDYSQKWYIKNKEKVLKQQKKYEQNNKEKIANTKRLYREKNKDKIDKRMTKWRKANLDRVNKQQREWRKNNPEKAKAFYNKSRQKNIDKIKMHERIKNARRRNATGTYTVEQWKSLINKHNSKCAMCYKERKLTVDHIIPISKWNEWIKKHPEIKYQCNQIDNLQPLCQSCNSSKGIKIF